MYIAGTMIVWVARSRTASARNSAALNTGRISSVPATRSIVISCAINPVTWLSGTHASERSAALRPIAAS